jgi:hypothetical protein
MLPSGTLHLIYICFRQHITCHDAPLTSLISPRYRTLLLTMIMRMISDLSLRLES